MSKGSIIRRGQNSWRLKFDLPERDPTTGKRQIQYHTFRGTKREAQAKLTELIASVGAGSYIEPTKMTTAELVAARVDQWEASGTITARTAQRYRELIAGQIVPFIGNFQIQKLRPLHIEKWHSDLRDHGRIDGGGASALTIGHAHRLLSKALDDAVRNDMATRNVCKVQAPPRVHREPLTIVKDTRAFIEKLEGQLRVPALIALFTGMRRGEVLALRWHHVDLDAGVIHVREALEQTKAHGVRFKVPKSAAGVRNITMPDILITALRDYRKEQLELRLRLALGKMPDDALLFTDIDGNPISPNRFSANWSDFAERIDMREVSFHALRHTHASWLIDRDVDIVTIAQRLGHAKPDVTLRTYSHLFRKDDSKAARAINEAIASL